MFVGVPNPNMLMPLAKMTILNLENKKSFEVLYNPQSYQQSRSVEYAQIPAMGTDVPRGQFSHGSGETLKVQLFFDCLSAGSEVGGTPLDKLKFAANSILSSSGNQLDVRDYTEKIYNLTLIQDEKTSAPPKLMLLWGSLAFVGYLVSCTETFLRFDEAGIPVRATLDCEFREFANDGHIAEIMAEKTRQKTKNTKYRVASAGVTLAAIAAMEYGSAERWRDIASANEVSNPRSVRTGDTLVVPGD